MNKMKYKFNDNNLISFSDIFDSRSEKGVICKYSAAYAWGFNKQKPDKTYITFPKFYNPAKKEAWMKLNYKVIKRYELQIETIKLNNISYRIYSPERTIVEIIKDNINNMNKYNIGITQNFFNSYKYDPKKLKEAASEFNVTEYVNMMVAIANYQKGDK